MIRFVLNFFGALFSFATNGAVFGALAAGGVFWVYSQDLPSHERLANYTPKTISRIYSGEGRMIDEFAEERRLFTPAEEIPDLVKNAFISAEDKNFYLHKGYDARGIAAALIEAARSRGQNLRGASTITQQVMKNFLLSGDRRIERKIKEVILATRLEETLSKDKILELYLNEIFLGQNSYGVTAAAQSYFNKTLSELEPHEAAMLAAMPKAPSDYHPVYAKQRLLDRRNYVLREMWQNGYLDEATYRAEREMPLRSVQNGDFPAFRDSLPPRDYFTDEIRRQLSQSFGEEEFFGGGLTIRATIDPEMQKVAAGALREALESYDRDRGVWRGTGVTIPVEALEQDWRAALASAEVSRDIEGWYAAVVLRVGNNDARIGIEGIEDDEDGHWIAAEDVRWARPLREDGSLGGEARVAGDLLQVGDVVHVAALADDDGKFDRWSLRQVPEVQGAFMAMDVENGRVLAMQGGFSYQDSVFNRATQAQRQPGSSFKPFVYAAALDKGYTYNTTVLDEPVVYKVGKYKTWSPKNYGGSFRGPTPFQNCIRFSRNIPTVKITYDIGTHYLTAYERKMGITTPIEKYLSMALGANAVYLLEMVQAYSIFDNGGKRVVATAITKIEDAKGNVIEEAGISPETIASSAPEVVAEQEEVPAEGTLAGREVAENELNTELFERGRKAIEKEGLNLTDLELKTLYGAEIPPGHVITPQTAYLMVRLLKGVVEGGTGTRVRALGKPAAGKTGTTNDETDTWFIGFVPDLVAGVWVGFDELRKIGYRAAGGTIAAPIFLDFMKQATEGWEAKDFQRPESFPSADIATLAGGSAVFGARPGLEDMFLKGGSDRAGEFFEEDFEDYGGYGNEGYQGGYGDAEGL